MGPAQQPAGPGAVFHILEGRASTARRRLVLAELDPIDEYE
jgi:hypothetical protein